MSAAARFCAPLLWVEKISDLDLDGRDRPCAVSEGEEDDVPLDIRDERCVVKAWVEEEVMSFFDAFDLDFLMP